MKNKPKYKLRDLAGKALRFARKAFSFARKDQSFEVQASALCAQG